MTKSTNGSLKAGIIVTLIVLGIMLIIQTVFALIDSNGRLLLTSRSVAVDNLGNLYVLSGGRYNIQKLDSQGHFVTRWGTSGNGDGQFNGYSKPNSIVVDNNNNIYVTDSGNYRIQKFDSQGRFLTKWGTQGNGDGQFGATFNGPCGLGSDKQNDVYVFDCGNYRIQKFDSQGRFLTKWGTQGNGNGQFNEPYLSQFGGITVDKQDNIYVVDGANKRIEKFDYQGRFLLEWGSVGNGLGQFGTPTQVGPLGLAADNQLNIYVSDGFQIQKFDSNGHFLIQWDVTNVAPWPSESKEYDDSDSLAIDKQGIIYTVAGVYNDTHDRVEGTDYYNVHLQTFDSDGHFLKRWSDPFYLPWWFIFSAPLILGLLFSFLYSKLRK